MQPIKPKWMNSGLVLVCERCYKERIPEEDPEKAAEIGDFRLRDWLKTRLKEDGHWGKVRAISTSCMDVCARRRVTVVIDPQTDGKSSEAFVIDPVADRETLYATIVDRLVTDEGGNAIEHYEDERDAKTEAESGSSANR
jgi:predicted metal-binding protein